MNGLLAVIINILRIFGLIKVESALVREEEEKIITAADLIKRQRNKLANRDGQTKE